MKAVEFFTGLLSTALEPGEIIAAVEVPLAAPTQRVAIIEVARRSGDYAMAGIAAVLQLGQDGRVAAPRLTFFGVGNGPVLAVGANAALAGRVLDETAITAAAEALGADLDPPADLHGPPEMKRHLARVLLRRALTQFLPAKEMAA